MAAVSTQKKDIRMKILMVLTSHDRLGDTGRKTGFWLEEFAAPYYVFKDAGAEITLASPKGGQPPLDPKSVRPTRKPPLRSASRATRMRSGS
jgi:putative intracellular protease/amidase